LDTTGALLPTAASKTHNLYHMPYDDIRKFDCGSKEHPGFPDQKNISVPKPLLTELLDTLNGSSIRIPLNIELKTKPAWDQKYYPSVKFMADELMIILSDYQYSDLTTIQSFDVRAIQYIMTQSFPGRHALLVSENENLFEKLDHLPAWPDILSPEHTLVDSGICKMTKRNNTLLIPWTVNDTKRMSQLMELGVDGIITDYPNRLNEMLKADH
jgi:glycerophosphoryl diester phosphodiesterase